MKGVKKAILFTVVVTVVTFALTSAFMHTDDATKAAIVDSYVKNTQGMWTNRANISITTSQRAEPADNTGIVGVSGITPNVSVPEDIEEFIMLPFQDVLDIVLQPIAGKYSAADLEWDRLHVFNSTTSAILNDLYNNRATFTVKVWQWASADQTNFDKVSKDIPVECNPALEGIVKLIFNDIYNHPDKPVIQILKGYVVRGMASGGGKTSGHAFGCTFDINPTSMSQGLGNDMDTGRRQTPTPEQWAALPENHAKYEIFYEGCPVVQIFKAYGFYWGGNWTSYTDGMHFGFLGDNGRKGREKGQEAYRSVHQ